jgi:hypothetical protein
VIYVARLSPAMRLSRLTVGSTQGRTQMCAQCVVKHSVRQATSKCISAHTLVSGPIIVMNVIRHSHNAHHLLFISVTTQDRDHMSATSVIRVLCPKLCLKLIKPPTICEVLNLVLKIQSALYKLYFKTMLVIDMLHVYSKQLRVWYGPLN